jgi:hypothetical protein
LILNKSHLSLKRLHWGFWQNGTGKYFTSLIFYLVKVYINDLFGECSVFFKFNFVTVEKMTQNWNALQRFSLKSVYKWHWNTFFNYIFSIFLNYFFAHILWNQGPSWYWNLNFMFLDLSGVSLFKTFIKLKYCKFDNTILQITKGINKTAPKTNG